MELRTLKGGEIVPYLEDLARLRMEVFREWPYLYDGTPEEEREYLAAFQSAASSVLVVLLDGARVVGASSAVSLAEEQAALREPFESAGLAPAEWFYLAESVLLGGYRGRGYGHAFFDAREARGRELGFRQFTFCSVVRDANDVRRPEGARELVPFWKRRGYAEVAHAAALDWPEVGGSGPVRHTLRFWTKVT